MCIYTHNCKCKNSPVSTCEIQRRHNSAVLLACFNYPPNVEDKFNGLLHGKSTTAELFHDESRGRSLTCKTKWSCFSLLYCCCFITEDTNYNKASPASDLSGTETNIPKNGGQFNVRGQGKHRQICRIKHLSLECVEAELSFMSLCCHHTAPQLQKWLVVVGQIVHEY